MSGIGQNEATPYNSPTFGNPLSLRVDTGVGAMTISPSGRDIALASYVPADSGYELIF
jgi:hypothetical protein